MKHMLLALLGLLFAIPLHGATAQALGRCAAPTPDAACADIVNYPVWVNESQTQADAADAIRFVRPFLATVSLPCAQMATSFLCAKFYPECTTGVVNGSAVGLFHRPCRSVCETTYKVCMNDIQRLGALLTPSFLNCSDEDEDGPLYPEDSTGFDLMGSIVTTNCSVPQPANYTTDCLQPFFVRIPSGAVGWVPGKLNDILWTAAPQYRNVCSLRCPNPQYPPSYWKGIWTFTFSVSVVGTLFALLLFASFFTDKRRRRQYPDNLQFHSGIAAFFISISGLLLFSTGYQHPEDFLCHKPWHFASFKTRDLPCLISGTFLMFGTIAILSWWALSGVVIAIKELKLRIFSGKDSSRYYFLLCAIGWGIPVVNLVLAYTTPSTRNEFASLFPVPLCYPEPDHFLIIPIATLGGIGFISTTVAFIAAVKKSDAFDHHVRILVYNLVVAPPYTLVLAQRYYKSPITMFNNAVKVFQCLLVTESMGPCPPVDRIPEVFNYFVVLSLVLPSILLWVCMVPSLECLRLSVRFLLGFPVDGDHVQTAAAKTAPTKEPLFAQPLDAVAPQKPPSTGSFDYLERNLRESTTNVHSLMPI